MEKYMVSLDDFIDYLMKKWIITAVCIVLGICVFVLSALFLDNKITILPGANYAELKVQEAGFIEYIENAPLMKIDSSNIHERIIYISGITKRDFLKNLIESGNVWDNYEDETFKRYFVDHVTWNDTIEGSAEVKIQYYEEMECEKLAQHLWKYIVEYDHSLNVVLGDAYISNDEGIYDEQQWCMNRLKDIQGQLEYTAAGYVIEVNILAAALIGAVAGVFGSVAGIFIFFFAKEKRTPKDR